MATGYPIQPTSLIAPSTVVHPPGTLAVRPAATEHGPPGPRAVSWFWSHGRVTTALSGGCARCHRRGALIP
jgi:hypothetical protein